MKTKIILIVGSILMLRLADAGEKVKAIYYTGTVLEVQAPTETVKTYLLKVKTDKKGVITFSPYEELTERIKKLKPGQRIKIKRIPEDCFCICFQDFRIIKPKKK